MKLYLIEFSGFIKIGITKNINRRLRNIVSTCQEKPKNQCTFTMNENAEIAENEIKKILKGLGLGFDKRHRGLPATEIFKADFDTVRSLICSRFSAKCSDIKIEYTIESIDGTRKAGRKSLPFKSVNRRVPEPLLDKFEKWREDEVSKLMQ